METSVLPWETQQEMAPPFGEMLESWRASLFDNDPELLWLREAYQKQQMAKQQEILHKDLEQIKCRYPDECAEDVAELGEKFLSLMATGLVDAITAYETIRNAKHSGTPPSMGDIAPATEEKQGIFTREQVAKMTPAQVKRYFQRIEESMKKW